MLILFRIDIVNKYRGVILGMLAFFLNILLSYSPRFSEKIYRNAFYQGIRWLWDNTLGAFPFVGFFLFLLCVLYFFYSQKSRSFWLNVLNFLGTLVWSFYLLWGFNYSAVNVAEKLALKTNRLKETQLLNFLDITIQQASLSRDYLQASIITDDQLPNNLEDALRPLVETTLKELDYPVYGNVHCREISASGWMRSLGISGIYFPFALESFVDGSQIAISKTFAMAHEMAHGYGITNEGDANFIAYMSLVNSENPLFQYVGYYELLASQLIRLRNFDYDKYQEIRDGLPYWVKEDLDNERANYRKYQTKFPWLSNKMNDLYLKSQGVNDGTESYQSFIDLVYALKLK